VFDTNDSLLDTLDIYSSSGDSPINIKLGEIVPIVTAEAEKGNKAFFKFMGDICRYNGSQYDKAKIWYDKAIENNDIEAWYTVGLCLREGECGYRKNKSSGLAYLRKAASAGHDAAKEALKRKKLLSFFFGIIGSLGFILAGTWVYNLLSLDNVYILTFSIIGLLVAGFIITFKAWQTRKNILFLVILAISVISFAGMFAESKKSGSSKGVQTATLLMDASIFESERHFKGFKDLKAGDTVTITGSTTRNWTPVEHEGDKGLILQVYLEITNQAVQDLIQQAAGSTETVNAKTTGDTPLRLEPNGESSAIANLKKNTTVTLTGKKQKGTFRSTAGNIELECAEVIYGGQTGWVTIRYLSAP
jgi:hypothetical protein